MRVVLGANVGATSVAFPNISTGVYGFPKERAADIAIATVRDEIRTRTSIVRVVFVCFDAENERLYRERLATRS